MQLKDMLRKEYIRKSDKIFIATFFICLAAYILLCFQGYKEQLFYRDLNYINNSGTVSFLKSVFALFIFILSMSFHFIHWRKLKLLGIIFFMFSIYMFFITLFNPYNATLQNYINQFTSMSLWIYVYLFFYTLTKEFNIEYIRDRYILLFTLFFVALFVRNYISGVLLGISWSYIESYYCIMMLPFIMLLKGKWKYILVFIVLVTVLLASKRTGAIACIIAILVYFIISERKITKKFKNFLSLLILAVAFYAIANIFFTEQLNYITERFSNIKDDEGSGRTEVFAAVLNLVDQSSAESVWFGHGYNAVFKETNIGFSAHNDFLEVLFDYGIIGLLLYLSIYVAIIIRIIHTKNRELKISLIISFILFLLISIASHLILQPTSILCLCAFWGYVDGVQGNKYNLIKIQSK